MLDLEIAIVHKELKEYPEDAFSHAETNNPEANQEAEANQETEAETNQETETPVEQRELDAEVVEVAHLKAYSVQKMKKDKQT